MTRVAVIGSGISGMAAAYFLSRRHEVWLYERDLRLGGHTHTHNIQTSVGARPIDTGFIVHNDRTYPNLVRLLRELGVERQKSDMSFGVTDERNAREYSSRGLNGFFASRENLCRPAHYALFRSIVRFNRESTQRLREGIPPEMTLGEYIDRYGFSGDLTRLYLYPMASAVWSASLAHIDQFPAFMLLRFFENHGFLTIDDHPQWYTIRGGSSVYIPPLTAPYRDRIVTGAKIQAVFGGESGAAIHFPDGQKQIFDDVIFACHAPEALQLIGEASATERSLLGSFATTRNQATLHTDDRLLPRAKAARASWNYRIDNRSSAATVTYHMNRLQRLDTPEQYCVTLNDGETIGRGKSLREIAYSHPLFTIESVRAQQRWAEVSGVRHLHFCGAYWFYGFHEDGLNSAIRVAKALGVEW
jgi:predicted NAD/FAD-binding protein